MNCVNIIGVKEPMSEAEVQSLSSTETLFLLFVEEYRTGDGEDVQPDYTLHRVRTHGKYYEDIVKKLSNGSLIEIEGRLSNRIYPTMGGDAVMTDILVDDCFGKIIKLNQGHKLKQFPVGPRSEGHRPAGPREEGGFVT